MLNIKQQLNDLYPKYMEKHLFTIQDTNFIKGTAIIMLLIHHLFFSTNYGYSEFYIFEIPFWNFLAICSKSCINIFLLLSGYGLYKSFSENENILKFYLKRLKKIYSVYWYIWFIFIPISIILFGMNLAQIYGTEQYISKLIINIFGLQVFFHFWGVNPTFWFISLILLCYLIFPVFYFLSKKKFLLEITFFILFLLVSWIIGFSINNQLLYQNIATFILGIIIAKHNLFEKSHALLKQNRIYLISTILLLVISIIFHYTYIKTHNAPSGLQTPILNIIALLIIILCHYFKNLYSKFIIKLGTQSYYIFLFHTFYTSQWFYNYTYGIKYPILILLIIMLICSITTDILICIKETLKFILKKLLPNSFLH